MLPYLPLQITGLGLIIDSATGGTVNTTISSIVAFVIVIAFVLWAGLKGVARTSYFKDVMVLLAMLILCIMIPMHFSTGIGLGLSEIAEKMPQTLYVHGGNAYGVSWFISSMAISMIGVMFYALPLSWPALFASKSERTVRRNLIYLPIYSGLATIPMLVGYTSIIAYGLDQDGNSALLQMASDAVPGWVMGVILTAGAATAMVPSAALLVAIGPLVTNNVFMVKDPKRKVWFNQVVVMIAGLAALILALSMPDLLGNILLLTFSGSTQIVPAIAAALFLKKIPNKIAIISGL